MRLFLALALLMFVPGAAACTSPDLASHATFVEMVQNGSVVYRVDAARTWTGDPCVEHGLGHPQFDGRFIAWSGNASVEVADSYRHTHWSLAVRSSWSLGAGRLLEPLPDGHLRVHDLVARTNTTVAPPAGMVFSFVEGRFAVATKGSVAAPDASHGTSLYDASSRAWILQGVRLDGAGWPSAPKRIVGIDRDWLVVRAEDATNGPSLWAYGVADGSRHGPLSTGVNASGVPDVLELRNGAAYVVRVTSQPGETYAEEAWSVTLPDLAFAATGRPPPVTIGNRTAWFTLADAPAATATPESPGVATTGDAGGERTVHAGPGSGGQGQATPGVGALVSGTACLLAFAVARVLRASRR